MGEVDVFCFIVRECRSGWEVGVKPLVDELVRVSVEPPLRRHGGLVEVVALVAALAGLDEHHGPAEALAVGAGEGHAGGARATRRAAAAVPAHAAVVGPVQAGAPAARVGQAVGLRGLVGAGALPSFLDGDGHGAAGPNVAQTRLLDQLTPGVVIGDTRGDAHPAAPRTLGPGSSLNRALISHLPPGRHVFVSTQLVPLASNLHQLVAQGVLLLFGFVGVQLPVGFRVRLREGVGRVGNEGVRRVGRRMRSAEHRGHDGGAPVAVDGEAALAWHLDQMWGGTGGRRQGHVAGAEGHAAHRSVDAGAVVLAARVEILAVLINPPVVFTRAALRLCPADAMGTAHIVAVVALQASVVVTGPSLVAILVELTGAHLAAAAAVRYRADPWGTGCGP